MKSAVVEIAKGTPLPLKVYVVGLVMRQLLRRLGYVVLTEERLGWNKWVMVVRV